MRAKSVVLLMLAVGCGLVASIGITQVMKARDTGTAPAQEMQAIFVALEDIPTGDLITAEVLKLEEWPQGKLPEGAITELENVEGRRPRSKIYAGTPILERTLLGQGMTASPVENIPIGYRSVAVKVDSESGGSNLIRPGDRVDVILFMQASPNRGVMETSVRTILQDIKIFAVNDVVNVDEAGGQQSFKAKTVSLLVTPPQAEVFTLATEMGQIRLSLRSHEDKEIAESQGAFPEQLEGSSGSDRGAEELPQRPSFAQNSEDLSSFLNTLKSRRQKEPEPVEDTETWTIRMIQGSQVSESVMQMKSETVASREESAGFNLWKLLPSRSTFREQGDRDLPGGTADQEGMDETADDSDKTDAQIEQGAGTELQPSENP